MEALGGVDRFTCRGVPLLRGVHGAHSGAIWRVREHWDDGEIVEQMGVISLFGFLNRWNDGMSTQLETDAHEAGGRLLKSLSWRAAKHL